MRELPDYPWDTLTPYRQIAENYPGRLLNLSIGTPVDPTPQVVQDALIRSADAPGYPTTHGTVTLRSAIAQWFARRRRVPDLHPDNVLPTIGSKEFIAWLPTLLGLGANDVVLHPAIAYPTYAIGAQLAGAQAVATADPTTLDDATLAKVKLIWLNSPSNPTGEVSSVEYLRSVVKLARRIGAVVVSDECYAELPWDIDHVPSVLDPQVVGSDHASVLAIYSVSKQSNLAGYRGAFAAGCPELIDGLLRLRKHAGMIVPAPVQHAVEVAISDDDHVTAQRQKYRRRRDILSAALREAGFNIEHSTAGLYLWCTDGSGDCWELLGKLAQLGIMVGPGAFYGNESENHVRIALTASDADIEEASRRLMTL